MTRALKILREYYLAYLAFLAWSTLCFLGGVWAMEIVAERVAVNAIQQISHHA